MKRLAELDSAKTIKLTEDTSMHHQAVVDKHELTKEASNGGYDLETTIDNPAWNGEDENIPDTIEIGVNYTISGSYVPARVQYDDHDHPEEHPDLDVDSIVNLETGEDIRNLIDKDTWARIEQEIWNKAEQDRDDDYDIPDDDYDDYAEDMSDQGNRGAHGEETISPIHGGQRKEETMENLNLESLRYLAGVNKKLAECGISPMNGSGSPASINITAGSGSELTGMLKDIMNLAGVQQVQPHHMPTDNPDAGPSTVISAPPMAGATGRQQDPNAEMHHLMAIIDGPDEQEDSMNVADDEQTDEGDERMYDTSPDEHVMDDPLAQFGDINSGDHRERQKGLPVAKPMETTFKKLMADYEQFIAEGKAAGPKETDVPAVLRKQKRPGQAAAQAATDQRNASSGAKVWSSKRTEEGKKGKCCCDTEGEDQCPVHAKMDEGKPSAGMTKKEKSSVAKKAVAGKDIGKPGKSFDKVAAKAGGGEKGKKIAAAAMWKAQAKK